MFQKIFQSNQLNKGKVVSFINQKGGVGKTTLLFNTAHSLKNKGYRVLCLDMDPQGNLTELMGAKLSESGCWQQLMNSVKELSHLHRPVSFSQGLFQKDGLTLLPSHQLLSSFDLTVASLMSPRQLILKKMIEIHLLKRDYDFILLDAPPTLGLLMVNIVAASDGVIIPFHTDRFSQQGLAHFHNMIDEVIDMQVGASPKIIGHIPNRVEGRKKSTQQSYQEIADQLKGQFFFEPIPNKAAINQASLQQSSVFDFASRPYRELQSHFDQISAKIEESFHEC